MTKIQQLTLEFGEYLKDESRSCGHADTISFPRTTDDVRQVLAELARLDQAIATQTTMLNEQVSHEVSALEELTTRLTQIAA